MCFLFFSRKGAKTQALPRFQSSFLCVFATLRENLLRSLKLATT
jgi:hypothetical protein